MVLVSRHTIGLNMLDAGTRTACQLPGVCFQTYSKEGCANSRCYRRNNRASANEKVRIEDFGGGEVSSNGYVGVAAILEDASCIWIVKIRIIE